MMQTRPTEQIDIDELSDEELKQVNGAMTAGDVIAAALMAALIIRASPAHMAKGPLL